MRQAGLDLDHVPFPVPRRSDDVRRQPVEQPERLELHRLARFR